ncbi:hypothetical protein CANARDRAFT_10239 [[Candida] arabinofermentans NRRL YB-2248]|uniref:Peptide hydrolase n=1 Tax=[Candida] arabinofermentans NRRL YB-2248 TaxID=983967 RepID=A0A1E4STN4_9ASCO|nr:hypothetical protein CANARDRAFT_10239 [[Candida] arabinofermentans NRRL YB-2248]
MPMSSKKHLIGAHIKPKIRSWLLLFLVTLAFFATKSIISALKSIRTVQISSNKEFPKHRLFSIYLNALEVNLASNWSEAYAGTPQLAGTNLEMVHWTKEKFEEYCFDSVEIDEYDVYVSYPVDQSLRLLEAKDSSLVYKPTLREKELPEDPVTSIYVPAFLGYAATGNVTSQFVYCNVGTKEDFKKLTDLGVELEGKIAIIRYSGYAQIFRGVQVQFAEKHGMIGVLLYTDPSQDYNITIQNGYKPYPYGPARNPSAIQRGAVQYLELGPGDPTTPSYAIKPGEDDKPRTDPFVTTPRIPALPISYEEVTPILAKLSGHGYQVPGWDGLIEGFDYSTGPNPDYTLNLYNKQDFNISTMHNILAKIEGENPEDVIIVGNHHDSWTPTAGDPHSGSAVILEFIRSLNELVKLGWKPKRSIWVASWDGEENAQLGSTEFCEYYSKQLQKNVIAYFNVDIGANGDKLAMGASPMVYDLLRQTAELLPYPSANGVQGSLYDHFKLVSNDSIRNLGSGSDYTSFLDHLGIPAVDFGFSNDESKGPVYHYHSIYDSHYWMSNYGDPGFVFHNLMAKYLGLVVINLSESELIYLRTAPYGNKLTQFFDALNIPERWLERSVSSIAGGQEFDLTQLPCSFRYRGVRSFKANASLGTLQELVDQVRTNLKMLTNTAYGFDNHVQDLQNKHNHYSQLSFYQRIRLHFQTKNANMKLKYFERHFLNPGGLPNGRSWFKHIVFTSGRDTGYGGKQLPGMLESIEDDDYNRYLDALTFFNGVLEGLIKLLKK